MIHARHAAQTVSEKQATSQWKSTGKSGAEEREMSGSSLIQGFGGDEITFSFHTRLVHHATTKLLI